MALNPPIQLAGVPLRVQDEYILLSRPQIQCHFKVPNMKKIDIKGILYLTSARLVLVNKEYKTDQIKQIDMPIQLMRKIDFKQPIFGQNYLKFTLLPLHGLLPAPAEVKLWFTKGGCEKFLKIFDVATNQIAQQLRNGKRTHEMSFNEKILQGFYGSEMYQDKNDPSRVYMEQPSGFVGDAGKNFYGNNYFAQNLNPNDGNKNNGKTMGKNGTSGATLGDLAKNNNQNNNNATTTFGNTNQNNITIPNDGNNTDNQMMTSNPFETNLQPDNLNNSNNNQPINVQNAFNNANNYMGNNNQGHATMNNPNAMNQAYNNNGNVSYYFGVPFGPKVENGGGQSQQW